MVVIEDMSLRAEVNKVLGYTIQTIQSNVKLESLLERIQNADNDLFNHSMNVAEYSIMIGIEFKFDLDRLINIGVGCILHDIGKSLLNPNILNKPDKLSVDERVFVESHPSIGFRLVKDAVIPDLVKDIIRLHHEKIDSTGYPDALAGDKISIDVQIVTVADMFDALTSRRSYKDPFTVEDALSILYQDVGLNKIVIGILENQLRVNSITGIIANKNYTYLENTSIVQ